ncbi:hypothetical protein DPSP01_013127 [Paraphaeosphaeria sporulosa]
MADSTTHPDEFDRLKNPEMRQILAANLLRVSGNKSELKLRYKTWFNAQDGTKNIAATAAGSSAIAGPSTAAGASSVVDPSAAGDVATVSAASEAPSTTALNPTTQVLTIRMLDRLFVPSEEKVSSVMLRCLKSLRYTPGENYKEKDPEKDFSDTLKPLVVFVSAFQSAMRKVQLAPDAGENETAARAYLKEALSKIVAPQELSLFFTGWGVAVEPEIDDASEVGRTEEAELDAQLGMAIDNSIVTAEAEARQREGSASPYIGSSTGNEDDEEEQRRKELLRELDIVNTALHHRLVRWSSAFPKRPLSAMLWPVTYSSAECKQIRTFVRAYLKANELDNADPIDKEQETNAVNAILNDDEFPVATGRIDSVVKAVFLELRDNNMRVVRSRSQSIATATNSRATSRNPSPVKQQRAADDMIDTGAEADDDNAGVTRRTRKKRPRRRSSGVADDEEAEEDGGPIDRSRRSKRGRPTRKETEADEEAEDHSVVPSPGKRGFRVVHGVPEIEEEPHPVLSSRDNRRARVVHEVSDGEEGEGNAVVSSRRNRQSLG